jgi:hypothetical protein
LLFSSIQKTHIRTIARLLVVFAPLCLVTVAIPLFGNAALGVDATFTQLFMLCWLAEVLLLVLPRRRSLLLLLAVAELTPEQQRDLRSICKWVPNSLVAIRVTGVIVLQMILSGNNSRLPVNALVVKGAAVVVPNPMDDSRVTRAVALFNALRVIEFLLLARFCHIHYRVINHMLATLERLDHNTTAGGYFDPTGSQSSLLAIDEVVKGGIHSPTSPVSLSAGGSPGSMVPNGLIAPNHSITLEKIMNNATAARRLSLGCAVLSAVGCLQASLPFQGLVTLLIWVAQLCSNGNVVFSWSAGIANPSWLLCFGRQHISVRASARNVVHPHVLRKMNTQRKSRIGFSGALPTAMSNRFAMLTRGGKSNSKMMASERGALVE